MLHPYHGYNYLLARENLTDHLNKNEKQNKIRQRLLKIRAKKVIVATGSLERPLVFNNNDRPGIMLSSAIKKYADYYGVICGKKMFFLLIMILLMKVQFHYVKKELMLRQL